METRWLYHYPPKKGAAYFVEDNVIYEITASSPAYFIDGDTLFTMEGEPAFWISGDTIYDYNRPADPIFFFGA